MRGFLSMGASVLCMASACSGTLVVSKGTSGVGGDAVSGGTSNVNVTTSSVSSRGSTMTTASTSVSSSSTFTTGTGGSLASQCQAWVDEPGSGATQTITFVNQTSQTLYLPLFCDGHVAFTLATSTGTGNYVYVYDRTCLQTCQDLQTQPVAPCEACVPSVLSLAAGASQDFVWSGIALEPTLMPQSCFASSSSDGKCSIQEGASNGTYTAAATGSTECQGACACGPDGICSGTLGSATLQASATFTFPSAGPVNVVFSATTASDGG